MSKKRLFLAVKPDENHLDAILNFIKFNEKANLRWVKTENLHITCLFIGDVNTAQIPELITQIDEVLQTTRCFTLEAERFTFVPASHPRMIWLRFSRSKAFSKLSLLLSQKLLNQSPENPPRAHVTLSRFKKAPKVHILFSKLPEQLLSVNEILLFESILKPEGAEYNLIKSWKLK